MKVLILAAGYGSRLEKDILENEKYKNLKGINKALLPLHGIPLVQYWIQFLEKFKLETFIITNEHFYSQFEKFAKEYNFPVDHIINDHSVSNEKRLGSAGDIQYFVSKLNIKEDLMIIGGDTIFPKEDLKVIEKIFISKDYPHVLYYENLNVNTKLCGILEVDKESQEITSFLEKPEPNETSSRYCCPCFYFIDAKSVPLIDNFISETKILDSTGLFIQYLLKKTKVFGIEIKNRFDIGNLKGYIECNSYFQSISK